MLLPFRRPFHFPEGSILHSRTFRASSWRDATAGYCHLPQQCACWYSWLQSFYSQGTNKIVVPIKDKLIRCMKVCIRLHYCPAICREYRQTLRRKRKRAEKIPQAIRLSNKIGLVSLLNVVIIDPVLVLLYFAVQPSEPVVESDKKCAVV